MDLEELARQLAGESGNAIRILGILQERQRLQEQLSAGQVRIEELQSRLPSESAVILSLEESERMNRELSFYHELGALEEIQQRLAEAETLRGELNTERRQNRIQQAAVSASYNPTVLTRLLTTDLDIQVDGEEISVVSGENATRLTDYATEHWADFLPALQLQQGGAPGTSTRWITQPPVAQAVGPTSLITQLLESNQQRAEQGNALTHRLTVNTRSHNNGAN